ncbi:MAG: type V CRISPR-associated protein Cas4 [Mangrovibacterium sp.]
MENLIQITYLNDFIFCPYSIYLHQIFEDGEIESFQASPQSEGRMVHADIDSEEHQTKDSSCVKGIYVYSESLKLYGKIDSYFPERRALVERKKEIKVLYQGYLYQLWAQFFAMREMGYCVDEIAFETIVGKRYLLQQLPTVADYGRLKKVVLSMAAFRPEEFETQNSNKCVHCIYSALCDKTTVDHVYT